MPTTKGGGEDEWGRNRNVQHCPETQLRLAIGDELDSEGNEVGRKTGRNRQGMKMRGDERQGEAVKGQRLRGTKSSEDEGGTRKGDRNC